MKGNRIVVGFMALSLVLAAANSVMAQRGGGHGGYGGTSMVHRDGMGSNSAAGVREHRQDMVRDHQQMRNEQQMGQQSRHESAPRTGEPRRHDGDHNSQPAGTQEHRMEGSAPTEHPENDTPRGPSDHASTTAHEAVAHHGEGTGTASAVHAVNSAQSPEEKREKASTGQ